jgi:hypothetical protein
MSLLRSEGGVVVFTVIEDTDIESWSRDGDLERLRGRLDMI